MVSILADFKLLGRSLHPFLLSTKKKTILQQAQAHSLRAREIAVVSSKIIDIITKETSDDNQILGVKLRNLTVNDIDKNEKNETIRQQNLDKVKELFTTGVILDACYRIQERITSAQTVKNISATEIAASAANDINKQKFVFYPTWITTTQVFKHISNNRKSCIFSGDPGVGKTTSFMLYTILMNNITRFAYTVGDDKGVLFEKRILQNRQKFIYWTYLPGELQMKYILNQCPEMYQHDQNSKAYSDWLLKSPLNFCKSIHTFYTLKKQIQTVVIIDQINKLASEFRKFNKQKTDGQRIVKNAEISLKNQKQIEAKNKAELSLWEKKQVITDDNYNRQCVASIGEKVIYNSSANIEDYLLVKPTSDYQSMILEGHTSLERSQLKYVYRAQTQKAKEQVAYYLGLQYKRTYPEMTDAQIQEIKKYFLQKVNYAISLLQVAQLVKLYKKDSLIIFDTYLNNLHTNKFNNFKLFLVKVKAADALNESKLTILINYLYLEIKKFDNENNQPKILEFQRKNIFQEMKVFFPTMTNIDEVNDLIDKNIFQYSQESGNFISIVLAEYFEQLVNILRTLSHSLMQKQLDLAIALLSKTEASKSAFGDFVEKTLINALQQTVARNASFDISPSRGFMLRKKTQFYHFNSKRSKQESQAEYYEDNMKMVKKMADQHPDQTIFSTPITKNNKPSANSFCVDLCFAELKQKQNKYYFTFIDVKTGQKPNHLEKNKQAKEFKRRLGQSLKSFNIEYEASIIVLCPLKSIPTNSQNYPEITFYNIQQIRLHDVSPQSSITMKKCLQISAEMI